jgi:di/tricarboxylate transporter
MSVTTTAPARDSVDKRSCFAVLLAIATSQTASIWNVGIKTAAPQNMVAYGTGTFAARDFVRTGLVITAVGMVLLVVFALTYWSWMGYLVKAA